MAKHFLSYQPYIGHGQSWSSLPFPQERYVPYLQIWVLGTGHMGLKNTLGSRWRSPWREEGRCPSTDGWLPFVQQSPSTYYVPGTVLGTWKYRTKHPKCLPTWCLRFHLKCLRMLKAQGQVSLNWGCRLHLQLII